MPTRDKLLHITIHTLTAICFIASIAWVVLVLDVRSLRHDLADLESQRTNLAPSLDQHAALTRGSESVANFIQRTGRTIPPPTHLLQFAPDINTQLENAAATSITLTPFAASPPQTPFPTLTLSATAGSPEILRMLRNIESAPPLIRPSSLELNAIENRTPLVNATLTLQIITQAK